MSPMTWTDKLAELGISLPAVVPPVASYTPAVRTGNLVYTSGQLPIVDGELSARGKVHEGAEGVVRPDEATAAARVCALNAVAVAAEQAGFDGVIVERFVNANANRDHVMVVAHRGSWWDDGKIVLAENSISAIDRAVGIGAEMVELDVQKTLDGAYVILHDKTLDRTTTCRGTVAETTLDAVRAMEVASGEPLRVLKADGGATVSVGTSGHGQGHATSFAMIVADRLGVPMEQSHPAEVQLTRESDDRFAEIGVRAFERRSCRA